MTPPAPTGEPANAGSESLAGIEGVPVPILVLEAGGQLADANAAARETLRFDGDTLDEVWAGKLVPIAEAAVASKSPIEREIEIRIGENRRVFDVEVSSPGESEAAVLVLHDVTEQRNRIRALEHTEQVLEEAQEVANIGSWEWDVLADEIHWSDELYRIFGQDPETFEATFEAYMGNIHPEDAEDVGQVIAEGRETGDPFTFEHRIVRPDGEVRHLHCRGQVIADEDGDPVRMVGTAQDMTERHENRERLREYAANLEDANRELEHFAYVASHDLKEPLRTVNRYVQRLEQHLEDAMDETGREYMAFAMRGVHRMNRLISDLLTYCRTDHGESVFETVDLDRVLDEVQESLEGPIEDHGAEITRGELPKIQADPVQLRTVFQNLLSNAIKFHAEGQTPSVHISVEDEGSTWHCEVRDEGIGFDPKYADQIFDLFDRLHGPDSFEGTGVGLAVCRRC